MNKLNIRSKILGYLANISGSTFKLPILFLNIWLITSQSLYSQTSEYSIINILRPKAYCGVANTMIVYLNGIEVCKLQNGGRLEYKIYSEGSVRIDISNATNFGNLHADPITFTVVRNMSYYFAVGYSCVGTGDIELQQLSVNDDQEINIDKFNEDKLVELSENLNYPINKYIRSLAFEKTNWSELTLKSHWKQNGIDNIEGIYEGISSSGDGTKYKFGVIKDEDSYKIIYLSGKNTLNSNLWEEGQIKAILFKTATPYLFTARWLMQNNNINTDLYVSFDQMKMSVIFSDPKITEIICLKLYPSVDDTVNTNSEHISGTGFAISQEGYIVTNFHVIENAKSIKVKGVNNDYTKSYSASIIISDKVNDLSILKISDSAFVELSKIPFAVSNRPADVGTSIFILGYPLRATMGDELKLTDGIISAKSGFQGDVTSYQISAPAQPGNSGGPLFNSNGELIGVVNAKNIIAENATYAIKSNYLLNLIDMLPQSTTIPNTSNLADKTLVEQVKIISQFVYIIEVN